VSSDVIGPIAFDFVLRIVVRGVMDVTLVEEVCGVDRNDGPRHTAGFRIPGYMITHFESFEHWAEPMTSNGGRAEGWRQLASVIATSQA
jgi:hypothetical protein